MTHAPTFVPSVDPTTSLPTSAPSITGSVSMIELSTTVTESLPIAELDNIQQQSADTYGVDPEDVTVEVVYQTTGLIDVEITDDVSIDELEESLEEELATLLGVHEGTVEVTIDENGVVTYTITSDSAESAGEANEILSQPASQVILDDAISEEFDVSISSVNVEDDITADVVVTIDSSGAENNLEDAAQALEDVFQDQGYSAIAESNHRTCIPVIEFCLYAMNFY